MVILVLSPPTVHLKVMVSPGKVGGDAVNCPATLPADNQLNYNHHKSIHSLDFEEQGCLHSVEWNSGMEQWNGLLEWWNAS